MSYVYNIYLHIIILHIKLHGRIERFPGKKLCLQVHEDKDVVLL